MVTRMVRVVTGRKTKGKATDQACVDCGGTAQDWSFTGEPGGFSADPDDYVARCKSSKRRAA